MITLDTKGRGNHLLIDGKRIRPQKDGIYVVEHNLLKTEDLSTLPSGTNITVRYEEHSRMPEELVMINAIQVISAKKVWVLADQYRCRCCWQHALDWAKYFHAIDRIFQSVSPKQSRFKYDGIETGKDGTSFHTFSVEVANGTFIDVEQRVKDVVMPMLQPVLDYRDQIDEMTLKQFGV